MTQEKRTAVNGKTIQAASWLPLVVILLAQIQMAFNVNAIPVSIGPIVDELEVSPTSVGTALVFYSLFVAAFVMLGAKLGKVFGHRLVFQATALAHGAAMAVMALSTSAERAAARSDAVEKTVAADDESAPRIRAISEPFEFMKDRYGPGRRHAKDRPVAELPTADCRTVEVSARSQDQGFKTRPFDLGELM